MTRDQRIRLVMAVLRRRHWAYLAGVRSPRVVASERVYQSIRRRTEHAHPC